MRLCATEVAKVKLQIQLIYLRELQNILKCKKFVKNICLCV